MMTTTVGSEHFSLRRRHGGGYALTSHLEHGDEVREVLARHGFVGSGYCWDEVVGAVVAESMHGFEGFLTLDSEAGMFSVTCSTLLPLEVLRRHLGALVLDPPALEALINRSGLDDLRN